MTQLTEPSGDEGNDECPGPRDPAQPDCDDVGYCLLPEDPDHACPVRAPEAESDAHRPDPDYPDYCWCGRRREDCYA